MSPAAPAAPERAVRIVQEQAPALLRYFLRRVGDREDAADLLSETLLTVWRRIDRLPSDEDEARMWMYGIAAHTLRNGRRTLRRRSALAERLRGELAGAVDRGASPDERADMRLDVARALDSLGERDRELIQLLHWDGLSVAEAAVVLGMNPSTARTRYARARERLAPLLGAPHTGSSPHTSASGTTPGATVRGAATSPSGV